jgi:hypothetical protein
LYGWSSSVILNTLGGEHDRAEIGASLSENGEIVITQPSRSYILTVNGGSSSLKFALFEWEPAAGEPIQRPVSGRIERV